VAIPSNAVLRAAARWLEHWENGVARNRAFFTTLPEYADLSPSQYEAGLEWIRAAGLEPSAGASIPTEVFVAAVTDTRWFGDADALVASADELPEDAERAAQCLGVTRDQAYSALRAAWGRFDATLRKEVGDLGEQLLVAALRAAGVHKVDHVSLRSDGYGFDILATHETRTLLLEVKSTTRMNRAVVFLSRHEFEVMRRDPRWRMVLLHINVESQRLVSIKCVPSDWILASAPRDVTSQARWESLRLDTVTAPSVNGLTELGIDAS
jgi:uncharacterized protein DUF3883